MSDYVAKVKIQNGRIYTLMAAKGMKSQAALARAAGVQQTQVSDLMNFKLGPMRLDGKWKKCVVQIADALGCLEDDLFSPEQMALLVPTNRRDYMISHDEVMRIARNTEAPLRIEHEVEQRDLKNLLHTALDEALTPRQRRALVMYFGLEGCKRCTHQEIGIVLDVTAARVNQIINNAVRKLRQAGPARAMIEGYLQDDECIEHDWAGQITDDYCKRCGFPRDPDREDEELPSLNTLMEALEYANKNYRLLSVSKSDGMVVESFITPNGRNVVIKLPLNKQRWYDRPIGAEHG